MKKATGVLALILMITLLLNACASPYDSAKTDIFPANSNNSGNSNTQPSHSGNSGSADRNTVNNGSQSMAEGPRDEANSSSTSTYPHPDIENFTSESYLTINENEAVETKDESMLTFSLKIDTAAYTNVSRYINSGNHPPRDAVRTEELINYFTYDSQVTFEKDAPLGIYTELGRSPFNKNSYTAFIRVRSQDIDRSELPPSNLTFLIDTSGSMNSYDKLPLLQEGFALLAETLSEDDRVSIVTYAGNSAVVLDGVSGADTDRIKKAIYSLSAGGSTAGADGIKTAYALAEKNYLRNGNNRVILATDGDFNVGISSTDELARLVAEKRGNDVYMSILGFGTGNIREDIMETLSKEGNGNYSYISDLSAARKVLVDELSVNLFTIADDVKAQIEFNPVNVKSYRLVGYENRSLRNEDFVNDAKDAGEIGIGTDVVVMFELELYGNTNGSEYKYGGGESAAPDFADELFEVRIRYKNPGENESRLITSPVFFDDISRSGSTDFGFACSVEAFGDYLRNSKYSEGISLQSIFELAEDNLGRDSASYRIEFLRLLESYERIGG